MVNTGNSLILLSYFDDNSATAALLTFLFIYFLSTFIFFSVLLLYRFRRASSFDLAGTEANFLAFLFKFKNGNFLANAIVSISFFSFAGVPPLAGFFVKFLLFSEIFKNETIAGAVFFVVLLLTMLVSTFYYLRIISRIYFNSYIFADLLDQPRSFTISVILVSFSCVLLLFPVFQEFLYNYLLIIL